MTERIYDNDVLEFVTLSTEFCIRMEQAAQAEPQAFVGDMLKILPLLYVKAMAVSDAGVVEGYGEAERMVQEDDYNFVQSNIATVMGAMDDYLDVFVEDMKYSESPVCCTVSESLADIYQDLRNLVGHYKQGNDEAMTAALWETIDSLHTYWGQRLVNVLRPLHEAYESGQLKSNDQ